MSLYRITYTTVSKTWPYLTKERVTTDHYAATRTKAIQIALADDNAARLVSCQRIGFWPVP
jgi:hypothetical protein